MHKQTECKEEYTADMCEKDAIAEYHENGLESLVGSLEHFVNRRLYEAGFYNIYQQTNK